MFRYKHKIVVWYTEGEGVELFRSYADIISYYGWGSGFYSWVSRHGHPDEFEYRGVKVKRYEI